MQDISRLSSLLSRRTFLRGSSLGLGNIALGSLLARDGFAHGATDSINQGARPDLPHHPPRIKRVIFLCMAGGPSHLETFDEKPELARLDGQPCLLYTSDAADDLYTV